MVLKKSVCYNKCPLLKFPLYKGFSMRVSPWFDRFLKKVSAITNKNEVFIMIIHTVFSEFCRIDLSPYSGCALLRQLTDGWVGEAKRFSPLLKICYTYPAVMKLYTVVTYLKQFQKIYNLCGRLLELWWHQYLFTRYYLFFSVSVNTLAVFGKYLIIFIPNF